MSRCAYFSSFGWHCPRPAWKGDQYCLFHSENLRAKTEDFSTEMRAIKNGHPSCLYLSGVRHEVRFDGRTIVTIPKHDYLGFKFPGDCSDFSQRYFMSFACFDEAVFDYRARFDGCYFNNGVRFGAATFLDFAYFKGATVKGDAQFEGATFARSAHFNAMIIEGELGLRFCTFMTNILISQCKIHGIMMDECKYENGFLTVEDLLFQQPSLNKPSNIGAILDKARIINTDISFISFRGSFIYDVIFDSITFNMKRDIPWRISSFLSGRPREAVYEERRARNIQTATAQENTSTTIDAPEECVHKKAKLLRAFLNMQKNNIKEGGLFPRWIKRVETRLNRLDDKASAFCSAETVYRTFKHEMEKRHAYGLARRMRAGELECKLHGDSSWFEKILLIGYRFLNGYGLRWFRALLFWLICILSFAFGAYNGKIATHEEFDAGAKTTVTVQSNLNWQEAVWHSLEMTSVVVKPSKYIEDPGTRWIEFLERILSPALLLLFIQAARNAARD